MAKTSTNSVRKARPAISPEAASSQVITHFLKLGTTRAELEKEKLKRENKVLEAKAKAYESSEEIKTLYENALKAMRDYSGAGDPEDYEDY